MPQKSQNKAKGPITQDGLEFLINTQDSGENKTKIAKAKPSAVTIFPWFKSELGLDSIVEAVIFGFIYGLDLQNKVCFASNEYLAELAYRDKRSIIKCLDTLEEKKLIKCVENTSGKTKKYMVNKAKLVEIDRYRKPYDAGVDVICRKELKDFLSGLEQEETSLVIEEINDDGTYCITDNDCPW